MFESYKIWTRIRVLGLCLYNLVFTCPSLLYHGIIQKYNQWKYVPRINWKSENNSTVVYIHGRGGHPSDFDYITRNSCFHSICIDLGNTRHTSVDEDTEELQKFLQNIDENTKLILVGYSKGGLVATRYIQKYNDDKRISGVITLSSPLRGTQSTHLLSPTSVAHKDMGHNSELTIELNNMVTDIPIYHVVPTYDHLIIPSSSTFFDSTPNTRIYNYRVFYNHATLTFARDIINQVENWIKEIWQI